MRLLSPCAIPLLALGACSGTEEPTTDPTPTTTTTTTVASPGTLTVTTASVGPVDDPDGYELVVNDMAPVSIGVSEALRIELPGGTHQVSLRGVDPVCRATDGVKRQVRLDAGGQQDVRFEVFCPEQLEDHLLFHAGGDLFSVRPDGTERRLLTSFLGDVEAHQPTPSDGVTIFYLQLDEVGSTRHSLWRMELDGSNHELVHVADGLSAPAVSPDGSRVAYSDRDIHVLALATGKVTQLTDTPALEDDPSWSPDGTRIAFMRLDFGKAASRIWVMDADGSNAAELTDHPGNEISPAWSPDGTQIAYASDRGRVPFDLDPIGDFELHIVNADGTADRFVTNNTHDDVFPAWSADGTTLAYTTLDPETTNTADIAIIDASTPGASPDVIVETSDQEFTTTNSWGR
ncbi:MAG: hypothetical protein KTR31_16155 [Myxococcales bacterium]|nr:hypothetical protein [Myxococcales bacterium]